MTGHHAWLLAALVLAGCAGPSTSARLCPESRNVRCVTPLVCEWDDARGCQTCICEGHSSEPEWENDPYAD